MKRLLLMVAVAVGMTTSVYASACATTSLFNVASATYGTTYSDTGFSCTLDGYTFSNFQILANSTTDTGADIQLGIASVTATGLVFSTNLVEGQDVQLEYEIQSGISGMILGVSGAGNASISELVCSGEVTLGSYVNCSQSSQLASLGAGVGGTSFSAVGASSQDWVFKDINGGNIGGSSLSDFTQTIIPEPMTMSLMGIGLLGLGFLGRRLRK